MLLDFPYVYELDGNKLYCSAPDENSPTGLCGGEIDYDDGFNFLRCTKCGVQYRVKELAKAIKEETVMVRGSRRKSKMKVAIKRNGTLISTAEENILKEAAPKVSREQVFDGKPVGSLKVSIKREEKQVPANNKNNKKNGKKNHNNNNYRKNNNEGNNRGVVRYSGSGNEKAELSTVYGTMMSDIKTEKIKSYTAEELSGMEFEFSSFDAEHDLLILKGKDDLKICLDLETIDMETYNVFFEQSDYMIELEQVKKDLLEKEEALEAEKEANNSLRYSLEENTSSSNEAEELKVKLSEAISELEEKNKQIENLTNNENSDIDEEDEITRLKTTIINLEDKISNLESELESEKTRSSEDFVSTKEYNDKVEEVEQLSKTIDDMAETINKLTIESSENNGKDIEIDKLKKEIEREKEKLLNQQQDYEAKFKALEELLQKSNETIDSMMSDYPVEENTEESEEVDFDQFDNNFSCIHGIVTSFNEILDKTKEEGTEVAKYTEENNHKVIAFPDGEGGFIRDVEHNIIVTASINDMNVDDIVILNKRNYNQIMKKLEALNFKNSMKETPVGVTQQ